MAIGALIIGDEILTGKRQDKHLAACRSRRFAARGLDARLRALRRRRSRPPHRAAARIVRARRPRCSASAASARRRTTTRGRRRPRRSAFRSSVIPKRCARSRRSSAREAYPHRVLMAEFPAGSRIIPNPVNRVAAFRDPRPPLLARLSADGVADARLGARDVVSGPARGRRSRARDRRLRRGREPAAAADGRHASRGFRSVKLFSLPSFLADGGRRSSSACAAPPTDADDALALSARRRRGRGLSPRADRARRGLNAAGCAPAWTRRFWPRSRARCPCSFPPAS